MKIKLIKCYEEKIIDGFLLTLTFQAKNVNTESPIQTLQF